jgi:DNA invertase Pin-like site-specific DNA recombinase
MSEQSITDLLARVRTLQLAKRDTLKLSDKTQGEGHAVGYMRVSTQKQVIEDNSIPHQEQKITEYCKNKNLVLDHIYKDEGISGGLRDRKGLNDMLNGLIAGMKVIAISIDRMARNSEHLLNIKNSIHEKGCTMVILDRNIDTANEDSNFLIGILASVAEAERVNIKNKISAVMLDMSKRKTLRCKPRFGYKVIDKKVVKDEEEQAIISVLREWIRESPNITLTEMSRRLTADGVTIRKSAKIYPTTLKNIIEANKLRPIT